MFSFTRRRTIHAINQNRRGWETLKGRVGGKAFAEGFPPPLYNASDIIKFTPLGYMYPLPENVKIAFRHLVTDGMRD